jgi:hypothetical protein
LAGVILIKATTMGLALPFMSGFALYAGHLTEPGLTLVQVALSGGSLSLAIWFFRHCRD